MTVRLASLSTIFFLIGALVAISCSTATAQTYQRIRADFTIQETGSNKAQSLTIGTVYYDRTVGRLVYDISFPEKQKIVVENATVWRVDGAGNVRQELSRQVVQHSIFHLSLNGELPYFGLENSSYTMTEVEREDELVISTWEPPKDAPSNPGKLLLSQQNKQLHGLISYDAAGNILGKQLFRKYETVNGLPFPTEVLQFTYLEQAETQQRTTYKNISVNEAGNDEAYHYTAPGN